MLKEKRYVYTAVKQSLHSEELGEYQSYGIRATMESGEVGFVSDVSTESDFVERLCALCNENQLDPEQLPEIVEDFLTLA